MVTVWGRRNSFNVQKVMWMIGELCLEHEHINAGGSYGGLDDPKFLKMNPHGRVPVINDNGRIVWESHSIIRYLAARYGEGTFWPPEPSERSLADRWMDWSLATLQPAFMDVFWGFYRTPEKQRDWPMIRAAVERCSQHYRLLDQHLVSQAYLAGDDFTIADIPAGSSLYRYFELEIDHPPVPNVQAWYSRLCDRPPIRDHVMIPFDDLRGTLAY